jgi:uncharacterized protein (DUF433 family)
MKADLIHDLGQGPQIVGTRILVDHLVGHFLDPEVTEDSIRQRYDLTPEQVAAARAYAFRHPGETIERHLRVESRVAVGNSAELVEHATKARESFARFRDWLAERERADADALVANGTDHSGSRLNGSWPSFKQWLAERESPGGRES